jgi:hypothetical protein
MWAFTFGIGLDNPSSVILPSTLAGLAATLDDVTLASVGKAGAYGDLSATLDDVTVSSAGLASAYGDLSATLDDVTLVSAGLQMPAEAMTYNADATVGVVKDGSDLIGTVNDLSTGGRSPTQGTSGRKMTWIDNGSSNSAKDIMRSAPDGTNGKFASHSNSTACFSVANGYTAYLVFKRTAGSGGLMFLHNNNSVRGGWQLELSTNTRQMQARTSGGTVKSCQFGTYSNGTWERWIIRNWGGGSDDVDSTTWFKAAINGVNTTVSGSPWFWKHVTTSVTIVGSNNTTSGPSCDIAACGAFDAYLTDAQVAYLDAQLAALYG